MTSIRGHAVRVRFIPIGRDARSWVVVDQLPFELGQLGHVDDGESVEGIVTNVGGTLVLETPFPDPRIRVNGLPMHYGPLMPGDRLTIGDHEFVVSYERTTAFLPVSASYHLVDDGWSSR